MLTKLSCSDDGPEDVGLRNAMLRAKLIKETQHLMEERLAPAFPISLLLCYGGIE